MTSGREDVDVRKLGSAFDCLRKTRFTQEELLEFEYRINSHPEGVAVNSRLSPRRI